MPPSDDEAVRLQGEVIRLQAEVNRLQAEVDRLQAEAVQVQQRMPHLRAGVYSLLDLVDGGRPKLEWPEETRKTCAIVEQIRADAERNRAEADRLQAEANARMERANRVRSQTADEYAVNAARIIRQVLEEQGDISSNAIVAELERRGVPTPRGNVRWSRQQVRRVMQRSATGAG